MTTITLSSAISVSSTIEDSLFGANIIFDRDMVGETGTYDDVVQKLEISNIRYPGGGVTEIYFDPANPDNTSAFDVDGNPVTLMSLTDFLAYAGATGGTPSIVLPSKRYFSDRTDKGGNRYSDVPQEEIETFVYNVLDGVYGDVDIRAFELGNEWYNADDSGPALTAKEYGRVSSELARYVANAIEQYEADNGYTPDNWARPLVSVQMGRSAADNDAIIKQFSNFEMSKVGEVSTHLYPWGYDVTESHGDQRYENFAAWEAAAGRDLSLYVSEWNVATPNGDDGLAGASSTLKLFTDMVANGVDVADVWGVQQNTQSDFSGKEGKSDLTVAGEMYRMMSESLRGTELLDIDTGNPDLPVFGFQSADKVVLFVASRSADAQHVDLDFDALVGDYTHVWGKKLGVVPGQAADGYTSDAYITTYNEDELSSTNGNFAMDLNAYEVIRLEFTKNGGGVEMYGFDQINGAGLDYADQLEGADGDDVIDGHSGDDVLVGAGGNDTLTGGTDNDTLTGGAGADIFAFTTGDGNDTITDYDPNTDTITVDGVQVDLRNPAAGISVTADYDAGTFLVEYGTGDSILIEGSYELAEAYPDLINFVPNVTITGTDAADTLEGSAGHEVIMGNGGNDVIRTYGGHDRVYAGDGNDKMFAYEGMEQFHGEGGTDYVFYTQSTEAVNVDLAANTGQGGYAEGDTYYGVEAVRGSLYNDTIAGDAGNDKLYGYKGDDALDGRGGNDQLFGQDGDDVLDGGAGNDQYTGGAGADTFVANVGDGLDKIRDFEDGVDLIKMIGQSWGEIQLTQNGSDVDVEYGNGDVLTIENTSVADITEADFNFG